MYLDHSFPSLQITVQTMKFLLAQNLAPPGVSLLSLLLSLLPTVVSPQQLAYLQALSEVKKLKLIKFKVPQPLALVC